jgi:hypothetical protein
MIVRNTIAIWGWLICFAFLSGCGVMSWFLLTQGIPEGLSPLLAIGVNVFFWIIGGFGSAKMFSKPITSLHANTEGIATESIWLWKRRRSRYDKSRVLDVKINETKDSESDPYFEAIIEFDDGTEFIVIEGHSRDHCAKAVEALKGALGSS